jgi:hypothetical protein
MRIEWQISSADVAAVKNVVDLQKDRRFVRYRFDKNVAVEHAPSFDRERFWKAMVGAVLSSRQRSGPHSSLNRFLCCEDFPLTLEVARKKRSQLPAYAEQVLRAAGGLRYTRKRSGLIAENLETLDGGMWREVEGVAGELCEQRASPPDPSRIPAEQRAASLASRLKGVGPKQSRNVWQTLGMTRYETPLDSRITKWLNRYLEGIELRAVPLSDESYYCFVMTGIQSLCREADVLPCILDACIFSLNDEEWPDDALWW